MCVTINLSEHEGNQQQYYRAIDQVPQSPQTDTPLPVELYYESARQGDGGPEGYHLSYNIIYTHAALTTKYMYNFISIIGKIEPRLGSGEDTYKPVSIDLFAVRRSMENLNIYTT